MARKGSGGASTATQPPPEKSAEKSATRGKPFAKGKDGRRGRGPKKNAPNAGRPPSEFKRLMQGIASRADAITRLRKLTGTNKSVSDEVFLKAFKESADRGYGKAVQPLEHSGPDGDPIPVDTADQALRLILSELAGIASRKRAGKDP